MPTDLTPIQQQLIDGQADDAGRLQAEAEKQHAVDAFKTLDYLLTLPQFQWYMEHVIRPLVAEELANAIDISKESRARDISAQRHDFGQVILAAAAQKRVFWASKGDIQL